MSLHKQKTEIRLLFFWINFSSFILTIKLHRCEKNLTLFLFFIINFIWIRILRLAIYEYRDGIHPFDYEVIDKFKIFFLECNE